MSEESGKIGEQTISNTYINSTLPQTNMKCVKLEINYVQYMAIICFKLILIKLYHNSVFMCYNLIPTEYFFPCRCALFFNVVFMCVVLMVLVNFVSCLCPVYGLRTFFCSFLFLCVTLGLFMWFFIIFVLTFYQNVPAWVKTLNTE